MNNNLDELLQKIKKFRDERDWKQYHNHKDMAISIVLEASELLEHFQWKNKEQINDHIIKEKEKIEEEIADILIYLLEMADNLNINILEAAEKKLEKNAKKYPVEKAKGSAAKYTEL
ncbi:MAG: nucleotide pyrophosphohydrolase [Candidatus Aenigmarchaeota archaeon]|nr:nucleotide pyrophosphohydrolase [Candidatus Aenigmarchaeota archaeon]